MGEGPSSAWCGDRRCSGAAPAQCLSTSSAPPSCGSAGIADEQPHRPLSPPSGRGVGWTCPPEREARQQVSPGDMNAVGIDAQVLILKTLEFQLTASHLLRRWNAAVYTAGVIENGHARAILSPYGLHLCLYVYGCSYWVSVPMRSATTVSIT